MHLLAELVDNSLRASPPDSNVTFSFARAVDGGLLVEIADRGIGIPADELESINQRLAKGGEVGPDTARHMGLFVVSRLAERHGLTVRLRPTFDTARNPGITASVHIPDVLLVSPLALSHTGPQSRIEIEAEEYSAPQALSAPVAQQGLPAADDRHEYASSQPVDSADDVRADDSDDATRTTATPPMSTRPLPLHGMRSRPTRTNDAASRSAKRDGTSSPRPRRRSSTAAP